MTLGDELRRAIDGKWRHVREQSRLELAEMDLAYDMSLSLDEARERVLGQMKQLVPTGIPAAGFRVENGGTGDPGMAVTGIEMLAQFDLSLMVKAGVQWGLFRGALDLAGTRRHHEEYLRDATRFDLPGLLALTVSPKSGVHGKRVASLGRRFFQK